MTERADEVQEKFNRLERAEAALRRVRETAERWESNAEAYDKNTIHTPLQMSFAAAAKHILQALDGDGLKGDEDPRQDAGVEDSIYVTVKLNGLELQLASERSGQFGTIAPNISNRDRALCIALLDQAIEELNPNAQS